MVSIGSKLLHGTLFAERILKANIPYVFSQSEVYNMTNHLGGSLIEEVKSISISFSSSGMLNFGKI
jgi:hypothetical protein